MIHSKHLKQKTGALAEGLSSSTENVVLFSAFNPLLLALCFLLAAWDVFCGNNWIHNRVSNNILKSKRIEHAKLFAITHGHSDHIGALHHILRVRGQINRGGPPANVIMPEACLEPWRTLVAAAVSLDAGSETVMSEIDEVCTLMGTSTDTFNMIDLQLRQNRRIVSFPTDHRVPSCGYVVYEQRRHLKSTYTSWPKEEIRRAAQDGLEIYDINEVAMVAYTGDTTIRGVLDQPEFLKAEVLILECTFMCEKTLDRAAEYMHIHLEEIGLNAERFENKLLVLVHASSRYSLRQMRQYVMDLEMNYQILRGRIQLWSDG